MGHAGAIVSGTAGTAKAKAEALEARGVRVGRTPTAVAEIAAEIAGSLKPA
jgi:succinyl-CoA synthetase alpha subunit